MLRHCSFTVRLAWAFLRSRWQAGFFARPLMEAPDALELAPQLVVHLLIVPASAQSHVGNATG